MASPREEDLLNITKAYIDAWNARDLEAIMAFFTEDAVLRVGPPPAPPGSEFGVGKQQIRSAVRPQLSGFHVDAQNYRVSGNTVTFMAQVSADIFRHMGVDLIEGAVEAIFEGDKIRSWTITLSPETMEKLWASLE